MGCMPSLSLCAEHECRYQSTNSRGSSSLEITGIQLTVKIFGKGLDATTIQEVNWVGTSCAAKQFHEILLEDVSPGGAKWFVENFEKECLTWSKLIHPHLISEGCRKGSGHSGVCVCVCVCVCVYLCVCTCTDVHVWVWIC